MSHWHELDGFQLLSGLIAVIAAPIMLAMGAPAGWAFLILAAGITVLLAQWTIAAEITFEPLDPVHLFMCVAGMVCIGLAVIYLTRSADDLPTIFPGYDAHSENFQLVPGAVLLATGAVALGRAVASAHPTRRANH